MKIPCPKLLDTNIECPRRTYVAQHTGAHWRQNASLLTQSKKNEICKNCLNKHTR